MRWLIDTTYMNADALLWWRAKSPALRAVTIQAIYESDGRCTLDEIVRWRAAWPSRHVQPDGGSDASWLASRTALDNGEW